MVDSPSKHCNGQAHLSDSNTYWRCFRRVEHQPRWLQYIRVAILIYQEMYIQSHYTIFKDRYQILILCINIQSEHWLRYKWFLFCKNKLIYQKKSQSMRGTFCATLLGCKRYVNSLNTFCTHFVHFCTLSIRLSMWLRFIMFNLLLSYTKTLPNL